MGRQFRSLELVRSGLPRTLLVSRATWAPPMPISPPSDGPPLAFLCLHTGPSRHPLCPAGSPRRVSPSLEANLAYMAKEHGDEGLNIV